MIHMAESRELQLHIIDQGTKDGSTEKDINLSDHATTGNRRKYNRWIRVGFYTLLVLCCQSAATLLGRLYYTKGGQSKWMATLVQLAGFPLLLPYYFANGTKKSNANTIQSEIELPSTLTQVSIYVALGLLWALDCFLYSVGLMYLPVSTYSLICASQLGFNALFSFFLNSQKLTPYVVNSLVLLTISSVLLVFGQESDGVKVSKSKYVAGFISTVVASAGYALALSLTQLAFKKVFKRENFKVIIDMIFYPTVVAAFAILLGFFASGEWNGIKTEMDNYEMGKISYVMNLTWTAITWQLFSIGCIGLIFEVSSLFSNAISALGLPIIPVCAVVFFHDKMDGVKVLSMILAIWGFISYGYQQHLDESKSRTEATCVNRNEIDDANSVVVSTAEAVNGEELNSQKLGRTRRGG